MRSYNDPPTGASEYGRAALENETAKILAAPHGGRHMPIFRGACSVFELAAGGEIDPGFAQPERLSAGISVGKPEREVRRILKDARKRGFRQPRRAPESGRYSRRYVSIPRPAPPPRPDRR